MKCLGIDIGSTSIKGAVLDLEQRTVGATISRPFPTPLLDQPAGWVEIAPAAIESAVASVLASLIERAPDAQQLYCSGQMGGLILVNEQGKPLSNYISWRDQRTLAADPNGRCCLDNIRDRWESTDIFAAVGRELQPGSTLALLAWLNDRECLSAEAIPTTVGDFALGRLCGSAGPMHVTQTLGMLDLSTSTWHRDAFAVVGLERSRLPVLSQEESSVGVCEIAGHKLTVFGSYGDQQCALRGAGLQGDDLSLNISTGSQVSRRVKQFQPGDYQSRKYFFGDWLNTVTHLPAGRSLNVLVDLLTGLSRAEGIALQHPWQTIVRAASEVSSSDLQIDLTFFPGPLGTTGSLTGITTENLTVGHLFHAAFRAMADNYARVATRFGTPPWREVVLSGGLTQSVPLLREFLQEQFPVPLRESANEETLLGLLDIAAVNAGLASSTSGRIGS